VVVCSHPCTRYQSYWRIIITVMSYGIGDIGVAFVVLVLLVAWSLASSNSRADDFGEHLKARRTNEDAILAALEKACLQFRQIL